MKTFFIVIREYEGGRQWKHTDSFNFAMHLVNERQHKLYGFIDCTNKQIIPFIKTLMKGEVS